MFIDPAVPFHPAGAYHQDYLARHPDNPCIVSNDLPRMRSLEALFPESWQAPPVSVSTLASDD